MISLLCLAPKIDIFSVTNTLKEFRILLTSHFKKKKREGGNVSVSAWHVSSHHFDCVNNEKGNEDLFCSVLRLAPTWKEKKGLVMKGED